MSGGKALWFSPGPGSIAYLRVVCETPGRQAWVTVRWYPPDFGSPIETRVLDDPGLAAAVRAAGHGGLPAEPVLDLLRDKGAVPDEWLDYVQGV